MLRWFHYIRLIFITGLGRKLPSTKIRQAVQKAMARKMTTMRGVPQKINQVLALSEENTTGEQIRQQSLEDQQPLPLTVFLPALKKHGWFKKVTFLEKNGKPASLAQVHKAGIAGYPKLALKMKYPDIENFIETDSKVIDFVFGSFSKFKKGFNIDEYRHTLRQELNDELDYNREIYMQRRVFEQFKTDQHIRIPEPFEQLSDHETIVMQYLPAMPLKQFLNANVSDPVKQRASQAFIEFSLRLLFEKNMIHADPNHGNYGFTVTGDLVVYDYGSVIELPADFNIDLLVLLERVDNNRGDVLNPLAGLGFSRRQLSPIKEKLPAFISMLTEPFLSKGPYDLTRWNRKQRAVEILGEDRFQFMSAAGADFFLVMRFLFGLFYYPMQLTGTFFARNLVDAYISAFAEQINLRSSAHNSLKETAELNRLYLKINVIKDGKTKVRLNLDINEIENLHTIIPEDVKQKFQDDQVDLDAIISAARKNQYRPMVLFERETESATVKATIEE